MRVKSLHLYPVKSFRGISPTLLQISDRGFEHDRRWMLVDEEGQFLTQREYPQLCMVDVSLESGKLLLRHRKGIFSDLQVPFAPQGQETLRVKVWSSSVKALESSPMVSQVLSDWLGKSVRLVYMPDESQRIANPRVAKGLERISFADGYPYLLIGQGSLDDLNLRLVQPVPMDRFRPNIVVEGSLPFAEDGWDRIQIGEAIFRAVKPCARCTITTVNQDSGEKGQEPLRTLASFRTQENKVMFGQNLICEEGEVVKVGDRVLPLD